MGDNNKVSSTDGNFSQIRLKAMYENNRTAASYRDNHPVYDTSFSMKDIAIMLDKYELGAIDMSQYKKAANFFVKEKPSWEKRGNLVILDRGPQAMRRLLTRLTVGENKCTNLFPDERGQDNCKKAIEKVKEFLGEDEVTKAKQEEMENELWWDEFWDEFRMHTISAVILVGVFILGNYYFLESMQKKKAKKAGKNNKKGPPDNPTGGSPVVEPQTSPKTAPDQSAKAVRLDPATKAMSTFAMRYGAEGAKSFTPSDSEVSTSLPPMQRHVFVESDKGAVANLGGSLVLNSKAGDALERTTILSGLLAGIYMVARQYAAALLLLAPK